MGDYSGHKYTLIPFIRSSRTYLAIVIEVKTGITSWGTVLVLIGLRHKNRSLELYMSISVQMVTAVYVCMFKEITDLYNLRFLHFMNVIPQNEIVPRNTNNRETIRTQRNRKYIPVSEFSKTSAQIYLTAKLCMSENPLGPGETTSNHVLRNLALKHESTQDYMTLMLFLHECIPHCASLKHQGTTQSCQSSWKLEENPYHQ